VAASPSPPRFLTRYAFCSVLLFVLCRLRRFSFHAVRLLAFDDVRGGGDGLIDLDLGAKFEELIFLLREDVFEVEGAWESRCRR
jgi:hypothetical protein